MRNLINKEDWIKRLKGFEFSPPIEKWFLTTFVNSLVDHASAVQCVEGRKARAPQFRMLQELTKMPFHEVELLPDSSEFLKRGLHNNDLWYLSTDAIDEQAINHIADFFIASGLKNIRMSVTQLAEAMQKWELRLKLEALNADPEQRVELLADDLPGGYFAVKLGSRGAYQTEGATMSHCVASYWGRSNTTIISLRLLVNNTPQHSLTVELVNGVVKQVRSYKDLDAADGLPYEALRELAKRMGWTLVAGRIDGWPRKYILASETVWVADDDEEEYDEEDEDEDDEEEECDEDDEEEECDEDDDEEEYDEEDDDEEEYDEEDDDDLAFD